MTFIEGEMTRVVELQAKSYALLRWVGDGPGQSTLDFGVSHDTLTLTEAAAEWTRRNAHNLPKETRAEDTDQPAFAALFASYLTTSYTLLETPNLQYRSRTGCYCTFCARLRSASLLKVRQPDKKAQGRAREMKQLYVSGLATETGAPLAYAALAGILDDPGLAMPLSYATYGRELLRRSQFASQGEGILVLWREISWEKGKLRKGFTLSADAMLQSEAAIIEAITTTRQGKRI
ncbi:MAG: hypothetical protein H7145_07390 [Akkermansiaceae bacterium]|nr:hypothetical protein [Armatimonadota bacterium]